MWRGGSSLEPISENEPNREKTTEKKHHHHFCSRAAQSANSPYRYFMERKSFDAPSPLRSEVRWVKEIKNKKEKGEGREEMKEREEKEGDAGSGYFYVMEF